MNYNRNFAAVFRKLSLTSRSNPVRVLCHHHAPRTTSKSPPSNYVNHWKLDRAFPWMLLVALPVGLTCPSKPMDVLLVTCIVGHQYMGLSSVVTDYFKTSALGGLATKTAHGASIAISAATLVGLLYLVFTDIGIAETIRGIWAIKSK